MRQKMKNGVWVITVFLCLLLFNNCGKISTLNTLVSNGADGLPTPTPTPTPTPSPTATATPGDLPAAAQQIRLQPNGSLTTNELVTVGIPFAPGVLTDANNVSILDENGNTVAAFVKPLLRWHWTNNSIRAVKVQFFANVGTGKTFSFSYTTPRSQSITEQNIESGLRSGKEGYPEPKVMALLSPQWMTSSLIAGPQSVSVGNAQEQFASRQFDLWAGPNMSFNASAVWLYDRVTTMFKLYVKTGEAKYYKELFPSWRYYSTRYQLTGSCAGGWTNGANNACDVKYTYVQPALLAMGLFGDDSQLTAANFNTIGQFLNSANYLNPYTNLEGFFTERNVGVQLRGLVSIYEITGNAGVLTTILNGIDNMYNHMTANPDGFGAERCLRHSWAGHEGGDYPGNTRDDRGCSPWMMAMQLGGVYKAYQVIKDIPAYAARRDKALEILRSGAQYLIDQGFSTPQIRAASSSPNGWSSDCNTGGLDDLILYWSSSTASVSTIAGIADETADGSDAHNPEIWNTLNYIGLLESDSTRRNRIIAAMGRLEGYLNSSCAASSYTPRAFGWQNYDTEKGLR